jgi:hypothetical protein
MVNQKTMNNKKTKVKSYIRKGKLVKAFDRNIKTIFLKKDKQGKNKLTTTSKVILGIGGLAGLGIGGKRLLLSTNNPNNKVVNEVMKKAGEAQKNIYKKAREIERANMSPTEKAEELKNMGDYFKSQSKSTSSKTGSDFLDLRDRRLAKNQNKFLEARRQVDSLIDDKGKKITYKIWDDAKGLPSWNNELNQRNPKVYNRAERKRLSSIIVESVGRKKTSKRNFSFRKLVTFNY